MENLQRLLPYSRRLILLTALLLLSILISFPSIFSNGDDGWKTPFLPRDVLPLLPRQVSRPLLNCLRSPADLLPSFVGSANDSNDAYLEWKGACFYENRAWIEFHNKSGSEFGSGTLHIKVRNLGGMDIYHLASLIFRGIGLERIWEMGTFWFLLLVGRDYIIFLILIFELSGYV